MLFFYCNVSVFAVQILCPLILASHFRERSHTIALLFKTVHSCQVNHPSHDFLYELRLTGMKFSIVCFAFVAVSFAHVVATPIVEGTNKYYASHINALFLQKMTMKKVREYKRMFFETCMLLLRICTSTHREHSVNNRYGITIDC